MFSGKNDRTEENWNSFAAAAPEKKKTLIEKTPFRVSTIFQSLSINLKRGKAQEMNENVRKVLRDYNN